MRSPTSRPIYLLPLRRFSSTPSQTPHSSSSWKHRNGEESKAVKITVWWDFENCSIPTGVSPYRVAHRITSALRSNGIKGPLTITAFGNMFQLNQASHDALCTTGVGLNHVPNCGKNSTDRSILADLVYWVAQNPPPAHFFLISGDKDFASILHRLRMSNYNILLASGSYGSTALYSAATIVWNWDVLVRGDSLTGRHFNHPPDGLYGSWYGHCKASIEDIPLDSDESIRSQPVSEESGKLSADSTHSIPKALVRNISQILTSNPKGISINALSVELKKRQIPLDKDYYGHKKLSSLVSSLSNIAIVKPHPDFDYDLIAYNAYDKSKELDHPSPMSTLDDVVDHEEKQLTGPEEDAILAIQPSQSTVKVASHMKDREPSFLASPTVDNFPAEDSNSSILVYQTTGTRQVDVSDPIKENKSDVTMKDGVGVHEPVEEDDASKEGFFQRIWRTWVGIISWPASKMTDRSSSMVNSSKHDNIEQMPLTNDRISKESEKIQPKDEPIHHQVDSTSTNKTSSKKSENIQKVHCNDANNSILQKKSHYLFSKKHFWDSLEAFLSTPKGLELVSKSMTRKHLIQRLQGEGPLILNPLTDSDISHMVDLLVSEKWVDECRHRAFPFKLKIPVGRSCAPSYARGSEGLSRIFSSRGSQSLSRVSQGFEDPVSSKMDQRPPKNLVELKAWYCKIFEGNVNIEANDFKACFVKQFGNKIDVNSYGHSNMEDLLAACSTNSSNQENGKKLSQRSQNEMLSDCQKLLKDSLRENPAGVLLGTLRPMFLEKYGYVLDYKRLGYDKLSDMINIFPRVKVQDDLVVPDTAALKSLVSETLNSGTGIKKDANAAAHTEDGSWEELGPLTETQMLENKRKKEEQVELDEINLSDEEELSDSQTHRSTKTGESKIQGKSSLLEILESWHNSKEDEKNKLQAGNGLVDCSGSGSLLPLDSMPSNTLTSLKPKPSMKYNFVSNSSDETAKLADDMFRWLKKGTNSEQQGRSNDA